MKVKALRKGFDNTKLREEGEVFRMDTKKCPSWCEEIKDAKEQKSSGPITKSKGSTIEICAPYFEGFKTSDEVDAFVEGDGRAGIKALAEECKAKFTNPE